MKNFFKNSKTEFLSPIIIKNNGNTYLTLYDVMDTDSLLYDNEKHILYFQSMEDLKQFCEKNDLQTDNEIWCEYDFDTPIENPIDYHHTLNHWNLLNTIAKDFKMYFEGDCKKYNALYDLLFRLNTPIEPIPPTYTVSEKHLKYLLKIFRKKNRFLSHFKLYQEK